jgi:hypothetical protein
METTAKEGAVTCATMDSLASAVRIRREMRPLLWRIISTRKPQELKTSSSDRKMIR